MLKGLTKNWSLKLLSLAIAVALWAFVVGQEKAEITVKVPVEITGMPVDMVLANPVINEVEARLYGPQSLVRQVASRPQVKQLQLTGMGKGEHIFQVLPSDMNLPPAVNVVRISPSRLRVVLAPRVSRKTAVRPVIRGRPAKGFEVGEVTFKPAEVTVSGLEKDLADLDWVWTVPLDVSGANKNIEVKAALRPPTGREIRMKPTEVTALIKIRPKAPEPKAKPPAPEAAKQDK